MYYVCGWRVARTSLGRPKPPFNIPYTPAEFSKGIKTVEDCREVAIKIFKQYPFVVAIDVRTHKNTWSKWVCTFTPDVCEASNVACSLST